MLKKIEDKIGLWLMASLTLGLAPFNPPHIWGKLLWVAGGAVDMGPQDWGDLIMHGAPWVLLIVAAILKLKSTIASKKLDA